MPHRVAVASTLVTDIKHNSERVEQPARDEPGNSPRRDVHDERAQRENRQPSHAEVNNGREHWKARAERTLEGNARDRETPHDAEQGPAHGPRKVIKVKGV